MKGWTPLRWALVAAVALLAAGLAWQNHWLDGADSEEDSAESTMVLTAGRYIPALTVVRAPMVQPRAYPKAFIPPGALHSIKELQNENGGAVFAATVALPEGQPLTRAVLTELSRHHGMASLLAPGQVAVSFAVDPVRGAGGWIQPGDVVAVYSARRQDPAGSSRSTSLLFSSVRVLAVDHKRVGVMTEKPGVDDALGAPDSGDAVLTVAMNPIEAAKLVEAREQGRLSVMLRALGDDAPWPDRPGEVHG